MNLAIRQYKHLRGEGFTEHLAEERMTHGDPRVTFSWEVFELAAHAPDRLSQGEIEDRVMRGCMLDAAERASR